MRAKVAIVTLVIAWLLAGAVWAAETAVPFSPENLPPVLRALPPDVLLRVFSFTDKPPCLAGELERFEAWVKEDDVAVVGPKLAAIMQKYPNTSEAVQSLRGSVRYLRPTGRLDNGRGPLPLCNEPPFR